MTYYFLPLPTEMRAITHNPAKRQAQDTTCSRRTCRLRRNRRYFQASSSILAFCVAFRGLAVVGRCDEVVGIKCREKTEEELLGGIVTYGGLMQEML